MHSIRVFGVFDDADAAHEIFACWVTLHIFDKPLPEQMARGIHTAYHLYL